MLWLLQARELRREITQRVRVTAPDCPRGEDPLWQRRLGQAPVQLFV